MRGSRQRRDESVPIRPAQDHERGEQHRLDDQQAPVARRPHLFECAELSERADESSRPDDGDGNECERRKPPQHLLSIRVASRSECEGNDAAEPDGRARNVKDVGRQLDT